MITIFIPVPEYDASDCPGVSEIGFYVYYTEGGDLVCEYTEANELLACVGLALAIPVAAGTVRIYITNSAGDRVHVIDPATNKVVEEIVGIEIPSGVAFSPDAKRLYFSCEGEKTLDVVERVSKKIIAKVPLTGRPNSISATPDGKYVFVAIAQGPGGVDVIDAVAMKKIKTIPIKGAVHYAYLTPDNKYVAAMLVGGKIITIIDVATLEPIGDVNFKVGVRPVALS